MSKYQLMQGVKRSEWPYGYLFGESWHATDPKLRCESCELHFCFGGKTATTLTFKVNAIDRGRRYYSLLVFNDDACEVPTLFAEVRYVDEFASTADFKITFVVHEFRHVKEVLLWILHSIIVDLIIDNPLEDKDGRRLGSWYIGFSRKRIQEIDYYSKEFAQSLTCELMETLL